jgi:hypothetical protein
MTKFDCLIDDDYGAVAAYRFLAYSGYLHYEYYYYDLHGHDFCILFRLSGSFSYPIDDEVYV